MILIRNHAATALSIVENYRKYHSEHLGGYSEHPGRHSEHPGRHSEHPGRHSEHLIDTITV